MANDRNFGESQERTDHGNAARSNPLGQDQQSGQQSGQRQGTQQDNSDYGNMIDDDNQSGRLDDQGGAPGGYGQEKRQPSTGMEDDDGDEDMDDADTEQGGTSGLS